MLLKIDELNFIRTLTSLGNYYSFNYRRTF